MPRRKQTKAGTDKGAPARTRATAWRIQKLDNVPGPEADAGTLREHYRRLQNIFAVHQYDDVIAACHWCCDMDEQLAFSKPNTRGGAGMYCSGRCASAYAKYQQLIYDKPGEAGTSATSAAPPPEKLVEEAELAEEAPCTCTGESATTTEVGCAYHTDPDVEAEDEVKVNVPKAAWPEATKPTETEPTPDERWTEAKKNPQRKARKARKAKPERADGKCAKGEHEMTDENKYEYKGTVWCRACRKASRAASAANRKDK